MISGDFRYGYMPGKPDGSNSVTIHKLLKLDSRYFLIGRFRGTVDFEPAENTDYYTQYS